MNAYVIDQKQLKRYIIEIVVSLVIAFSLGFVLGMQQSKVSEDIENAKAAKSKQIELANQADSVSNAEENAAVVKSTELSAAEKVRLAKEKTAQKKIDQKERQRIAEEKQALKKLAEQKLARQKLAREKAAKEKLAREKLAREKAAKEKLAREKLAREKLAREKAAKEKLVREKLTQQQSQGSDGQVTSNIPAPVSNVTQVSTDKRVFSIQAGMFASKSNAESFIEKLEAKQFDAYVSDFESSTGTTKYNVRVGRFDDRDKARDLLKEFQKSFSSPAYVVIAQ